MEYTVNASRHTDIKSCYIITIKERTLKLTNVYILLKIVIPWLKTLSDALQPPFLEIHSQINERLVYSNFSKARFGTFACLSFFHIT